MIFFKKALQLINHSLSLRGLKYLIFFIFLEK